MPKGYGAGVASPHVSGMRGARKNSGDWNNESFKTSKDEGEVER